ncbi:MAG: hypothetical protein K2I16_11955 [Muribaculaceae bacterium]|nr:hypothetical protein [Muribaculaceae bacterium]
MKRFSINKIFSVVFLTFLLLLGCTSDSDPRLERIDRLSEKDPCLARAALDSINPKSLSTPARHFYDLLDIKIKDKNYVRHTSDSLITDVLSYYSSRKKTPRYPESLYYGGRVYADLGDCHTALKYYREALDLLKKDNSKTVLRIVTLSQTARLLIKLHLYEEAKDCLKESLGIETDMRDSLRLSYDMQLLGSIYMNQNQLDIAEKYYHRSKMLAVGKDDEQVSLMEVLLSAVQYAKGNYAEALNIIRPELDKDPLPNFNFTLSWGAKIYIKCGYPQIACMYAEKLINSPDPDHKRSGYEILLSEDLRGMVPADSLELYIYGYRDVLENYYNMHSARLAIEQEAHHNYKMHEEERIKADASRKMWQSRAENIGFVLCVVVLCWLFMDRHRKKEIIKSKNEIILLQKMISAKEATLNNLKSDNSDSIDQQSEPLPGNEDELKECLKEKFLKMQKESFQKIDVPKSLLMSDSHNMIQQYLDEDKIIPTKSPLWKRLEKDVLRVSPKFEENLVVLLGSKLSSVELNIALLIKCGIAPMKIARLIGKEKGTVSYYRSKWSKIIFGKNVGNELMDNIIRTL